MLWNRRIYLDYVAGVRGNPSSPHEEGRLAKQVLEDARTTIARLMEVKADDIVFTSGATDANNIAIRGLAQTGAHFLYLPSAHASVVETMKALEEQGVRIEPLVIKEGKVDIEKFKTQLRPETALVSMDAVCGETGTIWNTREVANVLSDRNSCYLHVDASQAPSTEKFSRAHFSADMLTLDGAKLGVPGTGCLVAHRTIPLKASYTGGGQERGLRPGTENVAAIAEFAARLSAATAARDVFATHALQMHEELVATVSDIPNLYINVGAKHVPNILNISLVGRDTDYLLALLDNDGFAVSTKSACETSNGEGSRAVLSLTGDTARASATLRISWGPDTRQADLARFAGALHKAVHFVDSTARQ